MALGLEEIKKTESEEVKKKHTPMLKFSKLVIKPDESLLDLIISFREKKMAKSYKQATLRPWHNFERKTNDLQVDKPASPKQQTNIKAQTLDLVNRIKSRAFELFNGMLT
ncbi:MAG: hypothetical protein ISR65_03050 [Bacteriovoracaceae bacterium]|nr:hypothetical protein [Bacteriovoracaceae bacterium]